MTAKVIKSARLSSPHGFSSVSVSGERLNMGFGVYSDDENVRENRRAFALSCGFAPPYAAGEKIFTSARQIHSDKIEYVTLENAGDDFECDGFVTDKKGIIIGVKTADCVPILLESGDGGVVAAVHAGWRGAALGIAALAVDKMEALGAERGKIRAAVGPAVDFESYEVGDDFAAALADMMRRSRSRAVAENAGDLARCVTGICCGRLHADIPALNREILALAGVQPENIDALGISTYKESGRFFSHRKFAGEPHGVMAALIAVRAKG